MPAIISKLRPSNVISRGMVLAMYKKYSVSSTGMRILCNRVNCFMFKPSIKLLPFAVTKSPIIMSNGGNISRTNLGGNASVFV